MLDLPDIISKTSNDSGNVTTPVEFATAIACERAYGKSMFVILQEPHAEHFAFLAWHGRRRSGESLPDFEPWQDTLEYCDLADDGNDDDDPTPV